MGTKSKILVVDDNEVVRQSFLRSLQSEYRDVELANDGAATLRAMEAKPFDVVLLDLRMPGMDGMAVLKAIKQRWPESEVVVITGYPSIETAIEAVRLGAFDYLSKPLGPDEVISVADEATTQKKWRLHGEQNTHSGGAMGRTSRRETTNYVH